MVEQWGVMRTDVAGYRGMPLRSVFVVDREGVVRWTWVRTQDMPLPDYDVVIAEARKVAEAAAAS